MLRRWLHATAFSLQFCPELDATVPSSFQCGQECAGTPTLTRQPPANSALTGAFFWAEKKTPENPQTTVAWSHGTNRVKGDLCVTLGRLGSVSVPLTRSLKRTGGKFGAHGAQPRCVQVSYCRTLRNTSNMQVDSLTSGDREASLALSLRRG